MIKAFASASSKRHGSEKPNWSRLLNTPGLMCCRSQLKKTWFAPLWVSLPCGDSGESKTHEIYWACDASISVTGSSNCLLVYTNSAASSENGDELWQFGNDARRCPKS